MRICSNSFWHVRRKRKTSDGKELWWKKAQTSEYSPQEGPDASEGPLWRHGPWAGARSVQRCKKNHLVVVFSAKTHKPLCPFKARVTERGTWQWEVATYLQRHLTGLGVDYPFLLYNPDAVITCLHDLDHVKFSATSVDMEDLYYYIPHEHLLLSVRYHIENSDLTAFQNSCGVSVDSVLERLSVNLSSLLLVHDDTIFVQRKEDSIRSDVAPIWSDIFQVFFWQEHKGQVDEQRWGGNVFTYEDDFR